MADDIKAQGPYKEIGQSGLKRHAGHVQEEFLKELQGSRGIAIYRQMQDNDPVIGATLFAVEQICRGVSWSVDAGGDGPEDQEAADFLLSCLDDMSVTWADTLSEILSMIPFGFSWHEIVYKRREGNNPDPSRCSKYSDGRIGWRKLPIRSQESLDSWVFDLDGGIQGMIQRPAPLYQSITIPIDRSLLFRPKASKNNPEGRSVLRNAYRAWYLKRNIENIEAIGIERDLAGLPVAKVPVEVIQQNSTALAEIKKIVMNIRRDEQEGIVWPLAYDSSGNELYKLELLTTGGRRQFDTSAIIQRYDQKIAMTMLADMILIGHSETGSYALMDSKVNLFERALNAWLDSIAEVFNRYAIPRLFALNGISLKSLPRLAHSPADAPDIKTLGEFIGALSGAGATLFPDDQLENYLRRAAQLPGKVESDMSVGKRDLAAIAKAEAAAQALLDELEAIDEEL